MPHHLTTTEQLCSCKAAAADLNQVRLSCQALHMPVPGLPVMLQVPTVFHTCVEGSCSAVPLPPTSRSLLSSHSMGKHRTPAALHLQTPLPQTCVGQSTQAYESYHIIMKICEM